MMLIKIRLNEYISFCMYIITVILIFQKKKKEKEKEKFSNLCQICAIREVETTTTNNVTTYLFVAASCPDVICMVIRRILSRI